MEFNKKEGLDVVSGILENLPKKALNNLNKVVQVALLTNLACSSTVFTAWDDTAGGRGGVGGLSGGESGTNAGNGGEKNGGSGGLEGGTGGIIAGGNSGVGGLDGGMGGLSTSGTGGIEGGAGGSSGFGGVGGMPNGGTSGSGGIGGVPNGGTSGSGGIGGVPNGGTSGSGGIGGVPNGGTSGSGGTGGTAFDCAGYATQKVFFDPEEIYTPYSINSCGQVNCTNENLTTNNFSTLGNWTVSNVIPQKTYIMQLKIVDSSIPSSTQIRRNDIYAVCGIEVKGVCRSDLKSLVSDSITLLSVINDPNLVALPKTELGRSTFNTPIGCNGSYFVTVKIVN